MGRRRFCEHVPSPLVPPPGEETGSGAPPCPGAEPRAGTPCGCTAGILVGSPKDGTAGCQPYAVCALPRRAVPGDGQAITQMVTKTALLTVPPPPPASPASTPITPDTSERPRLWERGAGYHPKPTEPEPALEAAAAGTPRSRGSDAHGLSPQSDSAHPGGTQVARTRDTMALAEQQAQSCLGRQRAGPREGLLSLAGGPVPGTSAPSLARPAPSPIPEPGEQAAGTVGGPAW